MNALCIYIYMLFSSSGTKKQNKTFAKMFVLLIPPNFLAPTKPEAIGSCRAKENSTCHRG